jgi:hypothetical protein
LHFRRNSPFAFHEPKFQKRWIWTRHPQAFQRLFIGTCLLLFFSKPLHDIFIAEPSPEGIERAEFLKKQMQKQGLWEFKDVIKRAKFWGEK